MNIISGKSIFAFLILLIVMSFVINNFMSNNNLAGNENKFKSTSIKQDKIIGVEIRQQNKQGDKFLIVADTLE